MPAHAVKNRPNKDRSDMDMPGLEASTVKLGFDWRIVRYEAEKPNPDSEVNISSE